MKNYFKILQDKYNPILSENKPLVIKITLDSRDRNIYYDNSCGCVDSLKRFTQKFSRDYECIGIISFNEISFIFDDTINLKKKVKKMDSQSLSSWFSQDVFYRLNLEFNKKGSLIYSKINVFNIFDNKKQSYIYSLTKQGCNDYVNYYSRKNFAFKEVFQKTQSEVLEMLEELNSIKFLTQDYIRNGALYKFGKSIEIKNVSLNKSEIFKISKDSNMSNNMSVNLIVSDNNDYDDI